MSGLSKTIRSAGIGASNLASWWTRRGAAGPNVVELHLQGQVDEISLHGLWRRFLPPAGLTLPAILFGLSLAEEDPRVRALVLKVGQHDLGWGRTEEIAEALRRFRAAGKSVLCHLEEPENIDTLLAAACDRVAMPPGMPLYLTGLLSEIMYFKDLLDKLEVRPELFQAGKYKSAVEPYTRKGMSPAHREALESMLESIYRHWVQSLAAGRGLPLEKVRDLIDQGPWMAEDCLDQGLIDALLYEDQIDDYLEKWLGLVPRRLPLDRYLKFAAPTASLADPWKKTPALALITAAGSIHGGESRYLGPGDATMGADTMRDALAHVREDDRIAAAVLRVDSPGGSAVHSDLIWREVERLRAVKPVVVSMADVAASGGYYIAMPADHIVASPTTLTGSIGVIGGKLNLKGLYGKLGINKEHVGRGRHADMHTDYGPYSPEIKQKVQKEMDTVYRVFIDKVAQGRHREAREIDEVAQGRVWTGEQAKERGLVDELGGLVTAIERAKERAGLPAGAKAPLLLLPRIRKFSFPVLPFTLPLHAGIGRVASTLLLQELLGEHAVLALMPYRIRVR